MARRGKVDFRDLEAFAKKVEDNLDETKTKAFMEACAKELAARLLRKVIKRTPVGNYRRMKKFVAKRKSKYHEKGDIYYKEVKYKEEGTLKKGWTDGVTQSAESYCSSLPISVVGNQIRIEVSNPVEYASYVEYGHRTSNHAGWVNGKYMMTFSAEEIRRDTPKILQMKIEKLLGEVFG